jgi:hypothetical protein
VVDAPAEQRELDTFALNQRLESAHPGGGRVVGDEQDGLHASAAR